MGCFITLNQKHKISSKLFFQTRLAIALPPSTPNVLSGSILPKSNRAKESVFATNV